MRHDLPGALALDLGRRGGPCPRARHGPPQQRRQRHAGGCGLGPPDGGLGRRYADGDQDRGGAHPLGCVATGETGAGATGREIRVSADSGGIEGDHPSPAPVLYTGYAGS